MPVVVALAAQVAVAQSAIGQYTQARVLCDPDWNGMHLSAAAGVTPGLPDEVVEYRFFVEAVNFGWIDFGVEPDADQTLSTEWYQITAQGTFIGHDPIGNPVQVTGGVTTGPQHSWTMPHETLYNVWTQYHWTVGGGFSEPILSQSVEYIGSANISSSVSGSCDLSLELPSV
jgi:hypothetical protein